jgi:hypothetical protein
LDKAMIPYCWWTSSFPFNPWVLRHCRQIGDHKNVGAERGSRCLRHYRQIGDRVQAQFGKHAHKLRIIRFWIAVWLLPIRFLKKEFHGKNFKSQNEVISMVRAFWPRSPFKSSHESSTNGSRDYTSVLRMR